jgi:hypothetical protein
VLVGTVLVLSACGQVRTSQLPSPSTDASPAIASSPTSEATPETAPVLSSPAALKITSLPFHTGEVLVPYGTATLGAAGGVPPYDWSISSGFLPAGLLFSGSNVSGTPSTAGTWTFTVRVIDTAGHAVAAIRSVTIARRLAASQSCPTSKPCQVEAGCLTVCGKFGGLAGGVGPYKYTLTAGTLPTKMGLSGLSLTGAFPAPATRAGTMTWLFTVMVTDALGVSAAVPADFFVFSHIAFSASSYTCDGDISVNGCTASLPYTLGTPGLATPVVKVTLISSTPAGMPLPATSSFTARSGIVTVSIPPTGCGPNQFLHVWVVSLVLVDQSPCSSSGNCTSAPAKVTITLVNSC